MLHRQVRQPLYVHIVLTRGGIRRFDDYAAKCNGKVVDGAFAFELFDTYGFPIDLTQLMASEKGLTVDMDGFNRGLAEQKERSRGAAKVESDDWQELMPGVEQEFVGYDTLRPTSTSPATAA